MRHAFQTQPDLQITPIEKIRLPRKSRDELPPILAGLQWLWMVLVRQACGGRKNAASLERGARAPIRPGWVRSSGRRSTGIEGRQRLLVIPG